MKKMREILSEKVMNVPAKVVNDFDELMKAAIAVGKGDSSANKKLDPLKQSIISALIAAQ